MFTFFRFFYSLRTIDDKNLPLCLRLLKFNCDREDSTELYILLHLTHDLLQLTKPSDKSLFQKSTSNTPTSTPSGGRSSKSSSNTTSNSTVVALGNPVVSRANASAGTLPWTTSQSSSFDSSTYKALACLNPPPALMSLLASHFIGSSIQGQDSLRHVATQPLLLNTLRLGLTPTSRIDLHPMWFGFLVSSLPSWGAATSMLINLVVSQMTAALHILAEPLYQLPIINTE